MLDSWHYNIFFWCQVVLFPRKWNRVRPRTCSTHRILIYEKCLSRSQLKSKSKAKQLQAECALNIRFSLCMHRCSGLLFFLPTSVFVASMIFYFHFSETREWDYATERMRVSLKEIKKISCYYFKCKHAWKHTRTDFCISDDKHYMHCTPLFIWFTLRVPICIDGKTLYALFRLHPLTSSTRSFTHSHTC